MPNTTNFNWTTPADTDLVKNGALAIRTLANGIDTSLVDLKGGTTGQVLSKATNTDLDFTWVAQDDSNAIQNAIIDAKGDLIVGTAADTPARLAVGATNGHVLTIDSSTASGLKWAATSAGAKTLTSIASGNAPAASSFSITGLTQDYFMLRLTDLKWGTAAGDIIIRLNNDNTAKYTFLVVTTTTGDTYQYYGTGTLGSFWGVSTVANKRDANNHRVIEINNGGGSGYHAYTLRGHHQNSGGSNVGVIGGGYYESTSPITSIQVIQADGYSFTSGTYELIGG